MNRISFVMVLAALAMQVSGQENRGTILGRIVDPSGAAVAAANVEALNVETGVVIRSTSNEAANYQIPFLNPGNYTLRIQHPGFKMVERAGIRVATNTQTTVDTALELGSATVIHGPAQVELKLADVPVTE